jgi:hypothetical protein
MDENLKMPLLNNSLVIMGYLIIFLVLELLNKMEL